MVRRAAMNSWLTDFGTASCTFISEWEIMSGAGIADWVVPTLALAHQSQGLQPLNVGQGTAHSRYALWAVAQRRNTSHLDVLVSLWGHQVNPSWRPLSDFDSGSVPFSHGWIRIDVPDWLPDDPHWNHYDRPYSAIMTLPQLLTDIDYLWDLELGGEGIRADFYDKVSDALPGCVCQTLMAVIPLLRGYADPNVLVSIAALLIANDVDLALDSLLDELGGVSVRGLLIAEHVENVQELIRTYGRP